MEIEDMIKRLDAGEKAIDLSIEKWEDILNGTGTDGSAGNCACCYVDTEGNNDCLTCPIHLYDTEQLDISKPGCDNAFKCNFCGNVPYETDKEGLKKAIKYLKRVKHWMIEKGEYEQNTLIN